MGELLLKLTVVFEKQMQATNDDGDDDPEENISKAKERPKRKVKAKTKVANTKAAGAV
jgi:hypothetical protein